MKKHYFNMVEVALALAVVGIGIAGVMALFPVGLNSVRDAMAESYSADIAEEFLGQISRECKNNWTYWIGTADNDGIIKNPAPTDMKTNPDLKKGEKLIDDIYYTHTDPEKPPIPDVFLISRSSGNIVDFEAHIQISKAPISNLNIAGQDIDFSKFQDGNPIRYQYGAVLYITISWPVGKPYSAREKRVYCKEIFRAM